MPDEVPLDIAGELWGLLQQLLHRPRSLAAPAVPVSSTGSGGHLDIVLPKHPLAGVVRLLEQRRGLGLADCHKPGLGGGRGGGSSALFAG